VSLRAYLQQAEEENQVLHVRDKISTHFEISHVARSFDVDGPVLLFENVKEARRKVVVNVCGTRERICMAIGVDRDGLYGRFIEALHSPNKTEVIEDGSVKEVVEKTVDLSALPILTHFEKDAGRYITSAVVHAKSIDGKIENVSVHRLRFLGKNHLAIRLVPRHLYRLWQMAREEGKDLDVSISIGVHPAVLLAASSSLQFGVCEFDFANALLPNGLRLIECENVNASAPADAELVLEGKISATKEVVEGPFVDVTGVYDLQRKQPVVTVVGFMHRKDYVYHGLLPSSVEHRLLMGVPHEVLIWEAVSKVVPRVCAVNLSVGGSGWLHAVISVEKQLDGDGKNALLAAFAAHPSLKHAVVVDPDIDVFSASDVEWAVATRFQASKDLIVIKNVRGSTLDSSADQNTGMTTKVGVDATRPLSKPKEKFEKARIPITERAKTISAKLHKL
jgi:2,5-furandicarboxylate decarboxylase 1